MNTHGGSSGDAPNSPLGGGKRKMDTQEALTIDTIRAAIQEELRLERRELKRELLAEVREVREEVRGHMGDTNRILKDLQALQATQGDDLRKLSHTQHQQAGALETLTTDQRALHDRLALLEGKFGTWQGSSHGGSSASTTDDDKRQPALIMGVARRLPGLRHPAAGTPDSRPTTPRSGPWGGICPWNPTRLHHHPHQSQGGGGRV